MTRRHICLVLGVVAAGAVAVFFLSRAPLPEPKPEPECSSCTARHKGMQRLRDILKANDTETD